MTTIDTEDKLTGVVSSRLLSHAITTYVLDANFIPVVLRSARAALFPGNALAPPRVVPDAQQQLGIRRNCATAILNSIPLEMQRTYWGTGNERRVAQVEEVLDLFGDSYANKHLVYGVVELILVRLMPELAEKGVTALLDERLS